MLTTLLLLASLLPQDPVAANPSPAAASPDPGRYDVVWTSPSADASGSMPLGNGEVAVNAWVEADGTLSFYVARTDAWSDNGRLLKVGLAHVAFDPPVVPDLERVDGFVQRLVLESGTMVVELRGDEAEAKVSLHVDAYAPTVVVLVQSDPPRPAVLTLDPWRIERTPYTEPQTSDLWEDRSKPDRLRGPVFVEPDVLLTDEDLAAVPGLPPAVGWYHHNVRSVGPEDLFQTQGLSAWYEARPDPLLHRTFGAVATAHEYGTRVDERTLRAAADGGPGRLGFDVTVHTEHPATPESWLAATAARIEGPGRAGEAWVRLVRHAAWWWDFWDRSWIHVERNRVASVQLLPTNDHRLRLGQDQTGGSAFDRNLVRVAIRRGATPPIPGVGDRPEVRPEDSLLDVSWPVAQSVADIDLDALASGQGLTLEAWFDADGAGRLLDRITPGGSDGWLLDVHPRGTPRLIVGTRTLTAPGALVGLDRPVHLAATLEPEAGTMALWVDGERVAEGPLGSLGPADDAEVVSRAYALQRYITACAGRGNYPIKFNGSLFTVPHEGRFGDADFRRWGPGYWWQNTRLPYLGSATSGDFEQPRTLFRMYAEELLELHVLRANVQLGQGGALLPECIYFFGPAFSEAYGWTPIEERGDDRIQESGWHKWEWVAGLELTWMMLDWHAHTEDADFASETLVPTAIEVLRFFDELYELDPLDPEGRYVMEPAQSLETWWDCTGPTPEIAGLQAVTEALLTFPEGLLAGEDRALVERVAARTPALPTHTVGGVEMLAPAERFADRRNVENPELYPVFPFRRVTFASDDRDRELALAALEARTDRGAFGWRQDDLFHAVLGLADGARQHLVTRASKHDPVQRFPAFWGPNYDWTPDQDHGGVLVRTLQQMLLQTDGDVIHLLPAWPSDWDADFRLHAPGRTVLTGTVRAGELVRLDVQPPGRRADVRLDGAPLDLAD